MKPFQASTKKACSRSLNITNIAISAGPPVTYSCTVCNKALLTKGQLRYHQYCGRTDKPYQCPLCELRFVMKSHRDYHVNTHSASRPFKCTKCPKAFRGPSQLRRHSIVHTGVSKFLCAKCPKVFRCRQALITHSYTHTGERPFKCDLCAKAYQNQSNLNKHRTVHSGERPFLCHVCGSTFRHSAHLESHLVIHSSDRKFCCGQCDLKFHMKRDLLRHQHSTHGGMLNFKCNICSMAFSRSDNRDRHIRLRHKQDIIASGNSHGGDNNSPVSIIHVEDSVETSSDPFVCDICGQAFPLVASFRLHRKIAHGIQQDVVASSATVTSATVLAPEPVQTIQTNLNRPSVIVFHGRK